MVVVADPIKGQFAASLLINEAIYVAFDEEVGCKSGDGNCIFGHFISISIAVDASVARYPHYLHFFWAGDEAVSNEADDVVGIVAIIYRLKTGQAISADDVFSCIFSGVLDGMEDCSSFGCKDGAKWKK